MSSPLLTKELARQIEQLDIEYTRSRMAGMQKAPGNPLGIEIQQFGNATAFLIQAWPNFWYGNKVVGLDPDSKTYLGKIVEFFRSYGLRFRFEITPGNLTHALAVRLHGLGFCQSGFSTAMYGTPLLSPDAILSDCVQIEEIHADELDAFLDLYQDGFELQRLNSQEKQVVRTWWEQARSDLHLYIAYIDETPASSETPPNNGFHRTRLRREEIGGSFLVDRSGAWSIMISPAAPVKSGVSNINKER